VNFVAVDDGIRQPRPVGTGKVFVTSVHSQQQGIIIN